MTPWQRLFTLVLVLAGLAPAPSLAAGDELGAEAAIALPMIDAHFHVLQWMDGPALVERMDRHRVQLAGGVGGGNLAAIEALGPRFIRPTGMGAWLSLHRNLTAAEFENPDTPAVHHALLVMEADLRDRGARAIGEIHVNARTTTQMPANRFKTPADSATLRAMLALAGKYGRPLNIHAQWDADTVQQVERLADSSPGARLVLSHCGSNARAEAVRALFERHANLACDLSARGSPPVQGRTAIFDEQHLEADWKQLIEDHPERFVIGMDTILDWPGYDRVMRAIRLGLLAHLSAETAEKVAWRNAQAWFGLR